MGVRRYTFNCAVVMTAVLLSAVLLGPAWGLTRWSSLRMVPDADLLPGGELTIGFDGLVSKSMQVTYGVDSVDSTVQTPLDTTLSQSFSQTYLLNIGLAEWVNVQLGYIDGFTLGFKARILGETSRGMPSLAIGAHNIFSHKEVNYFKYKSDTVNINNEFYAAFGKTFERMKLRLHAGIQSIPTIESEKLNPFFAIEKYFGFGLYTSLEVNRRNGGYHSHLFANIRTLFDKLEFSVGAVGLESMFFDANKSLAISLDPDVPNAFVTPGIWFGVRIHARAGFGERGGFKSVEERLKDQDTSIVNLRIELDSMRVELNNAHYAVNQMTQALGEVYDTADVNKLKNDILDNLERLKNLYESDEFDPDTARIIVARISFFGEKGVVILKQVLLDERTDTRIRMHAVTVLGQIGNREASEVLLDVLARTGNPDLKIEVLIALGKMKETRAMYLMEQMANDPNDAVALTAQDVLRRLAEQTGASLSPDLKMRLIPTGPQDTVNERKIKTQDIQAQPEHGFKSEPKHEPNASSNASTKQQE